MNPLLQMLTDQITDSAVDQISGKLGNTADTPKTKSAIDMALPLLMGALKNNTQSEEGINSLQSAVQKKHDGSMLDDISSLISNPSEGAGILKHLMGDKEQSAEELLAQQAGITASDSKSLLQTLAPIILSTIGKQTSGGTNFSNIASMISGGAEEAKEKSSLSNSLITSFLDADNDGSIMDDLLGMGMKFLTKA